MPERKTVAAAGIAAVALALLSGRGAAEDGGGNGNGGVSVTADATVSADGMTITADGSPSTASEAIDRYDWALRNDIGTEVTTGTGQTFSYQTQDTGSYTVSLTVTTVSGATDTKEWTVETQAVNQLSVSVTGLSLDGGELSVTASAAGDVSDTEYILYEVTEQSGGGTSYDTIARSGTLNGFVGSYSHPVDGSALGYAVDVFVNGTGGASDSGFAEIDNPSPGPVPPVVESVTVNTTINSVQATASFSGDVAETEYVFYAGYDRNDGSTGYDVIKDTGPMAGEVTSESAGHAADTPDEYYVEVTATGPDGAQDSNYDRVPYDGGSGNGNGGGGTTFENTLEITRDSRDWIDGGYPDTTVRVEFNDEISPRNVPSTQYSSNSLFSWVEVPMSEDRVVTIDYTGEITKLDWDRSQIITHRNGVRIDPYDVSGDGPRFSWTGGTDDVLEVTVYQTAEHYNNVGRPATKSAAEYLAGALERQGVSHDIIYGLPAIQSPTQYQLSRNPFDMDDPCWRDDSCDDWDCCTVWDSMPGALYFWNSKLGNSNFSSRYSDEIGEPTRMVGDAFVKRKDSNIIATNNRGGGVAYLRGNAAVFGGKNMWQQFRSYSPEGRQGLAMNQIHNCLHEVGHNMGYSHPDCETQTGEAWIDDNNKWNRTPTASNGGCENACGVYVPPRENADNGGAYFHPTYSDCAIDTFMDEMGPMAGNTDTDQVLTRTRIADTTDGRVIE